MGDPLHLDGGAYDIQQKLDLEQDLPDWHGVDQTLKVGGGFLGDRTAAYDDVGAGVRADVVKKFTQTTTFTLGAALDYASTREKTEVNLQALPVGETLNLLIATTTAAFTLDRSNSILNPTKGWRVEAEVDPTLITGDRNLEYVKVEGQISGYWPLGAGWPDLAARLKLGSIVGGSIPDVPADRRFYAGGGGSVRGYAYQGVGPRLSDNTPVGGVSLTEGSVEVRQPLSTRLGLVVFADVGDVGETSRPRFDDLAVGVGAGVRYDLGFGPAPGPRHAAESTQGRQPDPGLHQHRPGVLTAASASAEPTRPRARRWAIGVLILAVVLGASSALVRYGPTTDAGHALIARLASGQRVGDVGWLRGGRTRGRLLEWISAVARVQIADAHGVWLDARNLSAHWRPGELLKRREVRLTAVAARTITVIRAPVLLPSQFRRRPRRCRCGSTRPTPWSRWAAGLAGRRGDYLLEGRGDVGRDNTASGHLAAVSLNHPGDFLRVGFNITHTAISLEAHALEATGGALAGSLGLDPNQAFVLDARVHGGAARAGWFTLSTTVGKTSPAEARGQWSPAGGQASGRLDLTASRWLAPWRKGLGDQASFAVYATRAGKPTSTGSAPGRSGGQRRGHGPGGDRSAAQAGGSGWRRRGGERRQSLRPGRSSGARRREADRPMDRRRRPLAPGRRGRGGQGAGGGLQPGPGPGALPTRLRSRRADPEDPGDGSRRVGDEPGRGADRRGAPGGGGGRLAGRRAHPAAGGPGPRRRPRSPGPWRAGAVRRPVVRRPGAGARLQGGGAGRSGDHHRRSWKASQTSGTTPWTFSVDARGAGLRLASTEANSLLGAAPRLHGDGRYGAAGLTLEQLSFQGGAVSATGAGTAAADGGTQGAVRMDVQNGALALGPLEVTGPSRGLGGR